MKNKFNIWPDTDSGNQLCHEIEVIPDDLGISDKDWLRMSERQQEEIVKNFVFNRSWRRQ